MADILQVVANGLMAGAIYGLIAVALALVFGVLDVPQFAFGAHGMWAAYGMLWLLNSGVSYVLGFLIAVVFGAIVGGVTQILVFAPLEKKPPATMFLAAFGLLMVLQGIALIAFGPNPRVMPPIWPGVIEIFGIYLTYQRLIIIIGAFFAVFILNRFLFMTRAGLAIRSAGQNTVGASVIGINARRVGIVTMCIGSGLAALAGCLLAPLSQVYPTMGDSLIIKAFIIIIMAGMGTINGALATGIMIGLVESIGGLVLDPSLKDIYSIILLIAVLLFKPNGLFNVAQRRG